jgi:hypothetical protein
MMSGDGNCCIPLPQLLRPDAAIVGPRCKKYFVPMYSSFHLLELTFHLPELTFQRLEHKTYRASMAQLALYGAIRPSDKTKKMLTPVIIMFFLKSC